MPNSHKEVKFSDHYPNHDPEKWVMTQEAWTDRLIEVIRVDSMMVIMANDGPIYVTKDQAKKFFNLIEPKHYE